MVLHPGIKLEWARNKWSPGEIEEAKGITLAALALYEPSMRTTQPIRNQWAPAAPTRSDSSEARLHHNIATFHAKCESARRRAKNATPDSEDHTSSNEEEQKRHEDELREREREMELNRWLATGCIATGIDTDFTEILAYYKEHEHEFPRIFKLAMTVLAIPATSVPSERVFSSCAQTDTKYRNRLAPETVEMLQFLKFNQKNGAITFAADLDDELEEMVALTYDEMIEDD